MKLKGEIRGVLVALGVLMAGSLLTASAVAQPSEPQVPAARYTEVTAKDLEGMLQKKDFLFVNVHIPYEGEIRGTDLHVPYNEVEKNLERFPKDKKAKIVVYCRSGTMSEIASRNLVRLGYTNVFDLKGGMIAWQKTGLPLVHQPR